MFKQLIDYIFTRRYSDWSDVLEYTFGDELFLVQMKYSLKNNKKKFRTVKVASPFRNKTQIIKNNINKQ